MVSNIPEEFRKFVKNCHHLRRILRETQRSLDDITAANIFPAEEIRGQLLTPGILEKLTSMLESYPALLVLGHNCQAKAMLVNALLGQPVLPVSGGSWKWVRILFGRTNRVLLTIGLDFEVVERLEANENPWTTVPEEDLKTDSGEKTVPDHLSVLEVQICHPLLQDNVQLIIPPDCDATKSAGIQELQHKDLDRVLPIFIYALSKSTLTEQNMNELRELKELYPDVPVFFVCAAESLYTSSFSSHATVQYNSMMKTNSSDAKDEPLQTHEAGQYDTSLMALVHQLSSLGFLHLEDSICRGGPWSCCSRFPKPSDFYDEVQKLDQLVDFVRACLQSHLVEASTILNEIHAQSIRQFILSAFDMAREIQITPRRILYAQEKEAELYKNLMAIANEKQQEITELIQTTLQEMREGLVEKAARYRYQGLTLLASEEVESSQSVRVATSEIQHLVLSQLSNCVANQLVQSVDCLQDTFIGTLQRCLESLEKSFHEPEGSLRASDAVKQILSAAYNVELTTSSSSSLLHTFLERLRKLLHSFQLPWNATPRLDAHWRKRVATEMLDTLSAPRLARVISVQFRDRVRSSHEAFQAALRSLESHYSGKLERTEEQRIAIRKLHAPKLARFALESTSMSDMVRFGIPQLGKEIGRGQYGVVFSCESWGGTGPCAVKSVVPPDDKHWNDLAMEFYYTRTIPEHKNIVRLRGSVVDHSYGGGCTPAVLLVMDRLSRDLYCGLRSGLKWLVRLQIAIDVVEGIRYLHSQGLVHRDIKMKNVLLDFDNRAKLTDLGFCIPEAMMSGSIVGTPVHMAPELLCGHYDSSVDVYAFGILFWYICAGNVKLPYVFEQFKNKEQLWTSVKKGIRPERLPHFDDKCWFLMERCWSGDPSKRPLLGFVLPLLEDIKNYYASRHVTAKPSKQKCSTCCSSAAPWQHLCQFSCDDPLFYCDRSLS